MSVLPGQDVWIDVFVDGIPTGRDFAGFNYRLNYNASLLQVTAATHADAAVNLIASAPGSSVANLSGPLPDTDGQYAVGVADFGTAETGPAKGVLGRYKLTIPLLTLPGASGLSLSLVDLSDAASTPIAISEVNEAWLFVGLPCVEIPDPSAPPPAFTQSDALDPPEEPLPDPGVGGAPQAMQTSVFMAGTVNYSVVHAILLGPLAHYRVILCVTPIIARLVKDVDVSQGARGAVGWRNPEPVPPGSDGQPRAVVDVVRTARAGL